MKNCFSRDILLLLFAFLFKINTANATQLQDNSIISNDSINIIIDKFEKTQSTATRNTDVENINNEITVSKQKDILETYAGMVGDKRNSKGITLDFTMEQKGDGVWMLIINGNNINNLDLVNTYLQPNPARFLIDVNTKLLSYKSVNFTYQMPKDIRLKYGAQNGGYRIAMDLPDDTKIINKKVSKNEISIKFINQKIIDEKQQELIKQNKNLAQIDNDEGLQKISKNATFKKIKLEHEKPITIAIDAGHGGIDPGAKGASGVFEKNITLKYAKKLKNYLTKAGFVVVMTRETDKSLNLVDRTKLAHQKKADLFISLHTDAHENKKITGTTVYRLSHLDEEHPDWNKFYNKNYLPLQYEDYVNNRSILDILLGMTHQTLLEKSSIIVDNILMSLKNGNFCKNCRHGQRSFAVLRGLDMVSILIEIGYITNPNEEKKLLLESNIELFCKNLTNAIINTFE